MSPRVAISDMRTAEASPALRCPARCENLWVWTERRILPYSIVYTDPVTGDRGVLCYAPTREGAYEITADLAKEHPDLRFAVIVDDDESE